jgi:hypothetical protein
MREHLNAAIITAGILTAQRATRAIKERKAK